MGFVEFTQHWFMIFMDMCLPNINHQLQMKRKHSSLFSRQPTKIYHLFVAKRSMQKLFLHSRLFIYPNLPQGNTDDGSKSSNALVTEMMKDQNEQQLREKQCASDFFLHSVIEDYFIMGKKSPCHVLHQECICTVNSHFYVFINGQM